MLYLGYKMNAQEAKQHGLVSKVYSHDSLEEVWNYLNMISTLSSQVLISFDIFMLNHVNKMNRLISVNIYD